MNKLVCFLIVAITLMAAPFIPAPFVSAHEGHGHTPVTMKKAVEIALAAARDYTLKAPPFGLPQLHQSWRNLPESAARIHENTLGSYVVSILNTQQGKTLYVRILLDGTLVAANFSGEFGSSAATSSAN